MQNNRFKTERETLTVKHAPTCALVEELSTRLGVSMLIVDPYEQETVRVEGPAIVLTVTD